MSENKHTPEPWRTAERSGFPFHIDDARGESVAMMLADDDHDEQRGLDNARRIVACVNACAGIPTEMLEERRECAGAWFPELENAKKQRDELLAALEFMLERISEPPEANCSCHLSPPCADCIDFGGEREAFEEAKSAIANTRKAMGKCYYAPDGTLMNSDGTRSIFDDVDQ